MKGGYAALALVFLVSCRGTPPVISDYQPPPISAAAVLDAVPTADPILPVGNKSPYEVFGQQYAVMVSAKGYTEEGIASWYGMKFQGRATSNGERFDVYKATAAHKTLPLPSYLRVTNLNNGTSMIVRVNDRGPFVDDRLIDLSYGAAVRLGFDQQGTARVRLEHIDMVGRDDWREHHGKGYRRLQVGAYQSRVAADTIARNVRETIGSDILVEVTTVKEGADEVYRVRLGPVGKAEDLDDVQALLDRNGLPKGQRLP